MNKAVSGEKNLKRMFLRSLRLNYTGALTTMINTAADGMIIAHFLGAQAAAAFGLIFPVYSLISLVPALLRTSAQAELGRCLGRGDTETAGKSLSALLAAGLFAALPLMLLLPVFRGAAVRILSAGADYDSSTISLACGYLLFLAPAVLPIMLCAVLHPVMQLDGDAARSPRAIQAAAFVNLAGDLLNALVFHCGMEGMALVTALSCYTELWILLRHFHGSRAALRPAFPGLVSLKRSLRLSEGMPVMLRELAAFFCGILLNRLAFGLGGETALAVLAVGASLWVFLLPAAMAVSGACLTLGSVSAGEGDTKAVRTISRFGIRFSLIPCSIYALLFAAAAGPFASFCSGEDASLAAAALFYLRMLALSLPFVSLCQTLEALLIAEGRTFPAAVLGILDGGPAVFAASFMLARAAGPGGFFAGRPAGSIVLALAALLFCRRFFCLPGGKEESQPYAEDVLERTVCTKEEAAAFSENLRLFCLRRGFSRRTANAAALCAEELSMNALLWGYGTETESGVDLRAAFRAGELTLRLRDTGRCFDPKAYADQFRMIPEDPSRSAGLRIVSGMASEMRYTPLVDCNVVLIRIPRE